MNIDKKIDGSTMEVLLEGELDPVSSPILEGEIKNSIDGITSLIFDFTNLEYVSSAGLRVLLSFQKAMNQQGAMVIRNVNPEVMEVFEMTGFIDFLVIE